MRPTTSNRTTKNLLFLAESTARSSSRVEQKFWEDQLRLAVNKAMTPRGTKSIEAALDALIESESEAYEPMLVVAEECSESMVVEHEGQSWDALLITAPMLAWSRFHNTSTGKLSDQMLAELKQLLEEQIIAPGARLVMHHGLVTTEFLPENLIEVRNITQALVQKACGQKYDCPILEQHEEESHPLADGHFLLALIMAPRGQALFSWQIVPDLPHNKQKHMEKVWAESCAAITAGAFTGCETMFLLPQGFYSGTRNTDLSIRPFMLKAGLSWLQFSLKADMANIRAAIVPCGSQSLVEEYRIGYTTRQDNNVIYGGLWPAFQREESNPEGLNSQFNDAWDNITAILRASGIQEIRRIPDIQTPEFCEDCGTPFFPNMLGEMMHPDFPDDLDPSPLRFH